MMLIGEYLSRTDTETLAKLVQYQFEHYGLNLLDSIEGEKQEPLVTVSGVIESLESIDKEMRLPPHSRSELIDD